MSFRNWINEFILLPGSDIILKQEIKKYFNFLMKSQFWSIDELEEYQNIRLRNLITYSYNNVQYYRELFDKLHLKPSDIHSKYDLYKIPILTKSDIQQNIKNGKIISKNIHRNQIIINSSSGSTGEPLQYYMTKKSHSFEYACGIRGWYWMGFRLGDKYVKLSQNPRNNIIKKIQDKINRSLYLYSQQLIDNNFKEIIKKINKFKPTLIRGYPDVLLFLANYVIKNNIDIHTPKVITTTGNILYENARNIIEKVFKCKIYDSYSCEGGANFTECETHKCYHASMEYAITEVIKDHKEVRPGERGRIITTDLHNFIQPFIRYDSQDFVTKSKINCICGKNLLQIDKIEGRDSDILITPKGKFLIVHNFTVFFEWFESIEQFQIIQNTLDKLIFLLKVNSNYTIEVEKNILKYWENYINESIKIEINVVDNIPLTKSGKRRFLIRNKSIKLPF